MASCQYCLRAVARSVCKKAMWSPATRNIVRGLMGSLDCTGGSATLSSLGFAALATLGAGGGGGGVGGSSMMRVLSLGFLGALSLAPAGLPRLLGSAIASSLGACSAIVASFSKTCSLCSLCSAICSIQRKKHSSFYLIVTVILQLGRLVKRS